MVFLFLVQVDGGFMNTILFEILQIFYDFYWSSLLAHKVVSIIPSKTKLSPLGSVKVGAVEMPLRCEEVLSSR